MGKMDIRSDSFDLKLSSKNKLHSQLVFISTSLKMQIAQEINLYMTLFRTNQYSNIDEILKPLKSIVSIYLNFNKIKNRITKNTCDVIYTNVSKYRCQNSLHLINRMKVYSSLNLLKEVSDEEFLSVFSEIYAKLDHYNNLIRALTIVPDEFLLHKVNNSKQK